MHKSDLRQKILTITVYVAGHTGLGDAPLWVSVWTADGEEALVWRPEGTSVRGWREATIYLGRILGHFHIHFNSRRTEGKQGDVSIDQLEFLDCALPGRKWEKFYLLILLNTS